MDRPAAPGSPQGRGRDLAGRGRPRGGPGTPGRAGRGTVPADRPARHRRRQGLHRPVPGPGPDLRRRRAPRRGPDPRVRRCRDGDAGVPGQESRPRRRTVPAPAQPRRPGRSLPPPRRQRLAPGPGRAAHPDPVPPDPRPDPRPAQHRRRERPAWAAGRATADGQPGWILDPTTAAAYACDAHITPIITGHVDRVAVALAVRKFMAATQSAATGTCHHGASSAGTTGGQPATHCHVDGCTADPDTSGQHPGPVPMTLDELHRPVHPPGHRSPVRSYRPRRPPAHQPLAAPRPAGSACPWTSAR